jgi:hypothetical protein
MHPRLRFRVVLLTLGALLGYGLGIAEVVHHQGNWSCPHQEAR